MLKRNFRLRHRRDIGAVYRRGGAVQTPLLTLRAQSNRLDHARAAVVVSNKVAKSAVKRNRMRRRLYGLLEEIWTGLAAADILIIVKRDLVSEPVATLKTELTGGLKKLRLLES